MIEYILMDLDDTVLDFQRSEAAALRETLCAFDLEPTDAVVARYSAINDSQWKLLEKGELTREQVKLRRFQLLFEEMRCNRDADAAHVFYEKRLAEQAFLIDGALPLLQELQASYRLYAVSNATLAVQNRRIELSGIAPYFQGIFLSEQIGYVKPQREFFDRCFLEIPDFDPTRAILLGDSLTSDIQGGINAGVLTCWFNPKGALPKVGIVPDYTISSLEQFPNLLKGIDPDGKKTK